MPAVFRVEDTNNDPGVYRVRHKAQGDPDSETKLRRLRKGIADLRRRARICQKNNERYLDALAVVGSPPRVHDVIAPVINPADLNGRRVRAMHPWAEPDRVRPPLLKAIGNSDHLVNGFRNRDSSLPCSLLEQLTTRSSAGAAPASATSFASSAATP